MGYNLYDVLKKVVTYYKRKHMNIKYEIFYYDLNKNTHAQNL